MPVADNDQKSVIARVAGGARWGLAAASCYIAWAVVLFVVSGGATFHEKDASFGGVVVAYAVGGLAGGAIVGLLLPLMRFRFGAFIVGVIAFVPVELGFRVVEFGFAPWRYDDTLMVITLSTLLGGFGGLVVKEVMSDRSRQ